MVKGVGCVGVCKSVWGRELVFETPRWALGDKWVRECGDIETQELKCPMRMDTTVSPVGVCSSGDGLRPEPLGSVA